MNPSTNGWIKKLLNLQEKEDTLMSLDLKDFYLNLRTCGFIYGSNVLIAKKLIKEVDLTKEERCKINLLFAFKVTHNESNSTTNFIESVIEFYTAINEYKISIFDDILGGNNKFSTLEKIIHKRIQIDDNIISKSFNYFITNALLFVDVLAYQYYLKDHQITTNYIMNHEATIEAVVVQTLNTKQNKSKYDLSLLKLFESSLRFQNTNAIDYKEAIGMVRNKIEAQYLLDIACMSTWGDQEIDDDERYFLNALGKDLNLKTDEIRHSIASVNTFFSLHKKSIALLSSKNVVKSFYDNSSRMVSKLISRNKKRLQKELHESKEVMRLITQSTIRDLSQEEQKQLQDQLLDIFKTIPSLAIFMLPGGALLLPLVVKFIPKLLPSAFDDNRIKKE